MHHRTPSVKEDLDVKAKYLNVHSEPENPLDKYAVCVRACLINKSTKHGTATYILVKSKCFAQGTSISKTTNCVCVRAHAV